MSSTQKIADLRRHMASAGVGGYVQPVHDEFLSEYPPACNQRVAYLSGFTGSAGTLVVLEDKAALFVDGRYTLQAANEIDLGLFEIRNSSDLSPESWLAREAKDKKIGYDAALFTPTMIERFEKKNLTLVPTANLADSSWHDRPAIPATPIFLHDEHYAGESSAAKCARIAASLKEQGANAAFITAPDSVCWLLNIRAHDVECTPLALVRALLHEDGTVQLFTDASRLPSLASHISAATLESGLAALKGKRVLVDSANIPQSLLLMLEKADATITRGADPVTLPKARKNDVQLAAIREAHVRDGVAIVKLLHWLDTHSDIHSVSEIEIAERLLGFRKENEEFVEPSFPTIAGSGPNGAIVHYRANQKTNRTLKKGELLLLDSGGQYPGGTTDITRTIAIGAPTPEQVDRNTRVLKGHIALARAQFPEGTRGSQLDSLARQYLWQIGLDYDHGTGHGVGQFLGVHEGPQRISKRGGDEALKPGMILSNEPGYYKTGEYGIRIENLVVVRAQDASLGFETVTCAPLDLSLVSRELLAPHERQWLKDYHRFVADNLLPRLESKVRAWLQSQLKPWMAL